MKKKIDKEILIIIILLVAAVCGCMFIVMDKPKSIQDEDATNYMLSMVPEVEEVTIEEVVESRLTEPEPEEYEEVMTVTELSSQNIYTYDEDITDELTIVSRFAEEQGLQGVVTECDVEDEQGEDTPFMDGYSKYYVVYYQGEVTYIVVNDGVPEVWSE